MQQQMELLIHYNKLKALLEEEIEEIKICFQGKLLESYRAVLKRELDEVNEMIKILKYEL